MGSCAGDGNGVGMHARGRSAVAVDEAGGADVGGGGAGGGVGGGDVMAAGCAAADDGGVGRGVGTAPASVAAAPPHHQGASKLDLHLYVS